MKFFKRLRRNRAVRRTEKNIHSDSLTTGLTAWAMKQADEAEKR